MIWQAMENGAAAGAWLIGALAVIGLALVILGGICLLLLYAFGGEEEEREARKRGQREQAGTHRGGPAAPANLREYQGHSR